MLHDPLLRIGVIPVHPFGLFAAGGLIVAYIVSVLLARRARLSLRGFPSLFLFIVLGGLMAARLGYMLLHGPLNRGDAVTALSLWAGGLSLPAGVMGGSACLCLVTWARHQSFWAVADCVAPGTAIGFSIGVCGSPWAGEGWGLPTTGPVFMHVDPSLLPLSLVGSSNFTPLFAFEALTFAALSLLLLILVIDQPRSRTPVGFIGATFLIALLFCYAMLEPLSLYALTPTVVFETQVSCAVVIALTAGIAWFRSTAQRRHNAVSQEITHVQPILL